MPIYEGTTEVEYISKGNVPISKVYKGTDQVFDYTEEYTLNSATNVDLATWLAGQGASLIAPIIVNVPDGEIIGGVGDYALDVGDISPYNLITLNLAGQIQGEAGGHAIYSDYAIELNNAGTVSGAIVDVSDSNDPALVINVAATGKILGGGGDGGAGGSGGAGDENLDYADVADWDEQYVAGSTEYLITPSTGLRVAKWFGVTKYSGTGSPPHYSGGIGYTSGTFVKTVGLTNHFYCKRSLREGTAGTGGAGGVGQGYGQSKTSGAAGTMGTYNAGNGGDGGAGGDWGLGGSTGATGSQGYSDLNSTYNNGSAGSAGTAAGYAIECTTNVNIGT